MKYIKIVLVILLAAIGMNYLLNEGGLVQDAELEREKKKWDTIYQEAKKAVKNESDLAELNQWKKDIDAAMKSAIKEHKNTQKLLVAIDDIDKKAAPKRVKDILESIPDIIRSKSVPSYSSVNKNYTLASDYIEKSSNSPQANKYKLFKLALDNNDIALAEDIFSEFKVSNGGASELAYYHAKHGNCTKSQEYLDIVSAVKNEPKYYINHVSIQKHRVLVTEKQVLRRWSQSLLLCQSLESALSILATHYPMSISEDQYLLETYIDFATALNEAGYKDDADRFYGNANDLFANGTLYLPSIAKQHLAIYTLKFDGPQKAHQQLLEFPVVFGEREDSPFHGRAALDLTFVDYALNQDFSSALKIMDMKQIGFVSYINLVLELAAKELDKEEFKGFADKVVTLLNNTNLYKDGSYTRYDGLLSVSNYLHEKGYEKEASKLIDELYAQLEGSDQSFKDDKAGSLAEHLVLMGRIKEAEALMDKYPRRIGRHDAWYVIYGYHLSNNNKEEIERLEEKGKLAVILPMKTLDYLASKNKWKVAERIIDEQRPERQSEPYFTLALRKMGISRNMHSYKKERDGRYRDYFSPILKRKLCVEYDHCD